MNYNELIEKFYTCFSNGDYKGMTACYHSDIVFQDCVFGTLKGQRVFKMWEMLLSKSAGNSKINFHSIETSSEHGSANWSAEYEYGVKKRKVVNVVQAKFKFKDGFIIEHQDTFNLWNWTKQALGPVGYLMGWSNFMKNKIQKTTNKQLDDYIEIK